MRFLGVGETCDLGDLYCSLLKEGHEVRIGTSEPAAQGTLAGLCPRSTDWRDELDWIRDAGPNGVILFEAVSEGLGELQDQLRREGFNVIGGSAYGDRLENDRMFGQAILANLGFPQGHIWRFECAEEAEAFISSHPSRYVLKYEGADHASGDNYVGHCADGRDVAAILRSGHLSDTALKGSFVLMAFIDGVEIGVGAYFDGTRFLRPACLDWEHKRFFAGDLGELTGEMGTVVTFDRTQCFFDKTLAKMESRLRENGHVGYVNLNTIVNEAGIWPLEFTSRFGYPGFAVLGPLQDIGWGELFRRMVQGGPERFPTRTGFCVGVVITTPPFPYTRKQVAAPIGLPVLIDAELDRKHVHYGEVGLDRSGQLATSGLYGWTLVITGDGPTIAAAQDQAYRHANQVLIPNARYRLDIGDRLISGEYAEVESLGLLDSVDA